MKPVPIADAPRQLQKLARLLGSQTMLYRLRRRPNAWYAILESSTQPMPVYPLQSLRSSRR